MEFAFQLFGLHVTANRLLPGLEPIPTRGQGEDLSVHFGTAPPIDIREECTSRGELFYQSIYRTESGEPAFRTWAVRGRSLMRIEYQDSTEFCIDLNRGNIWAEWGEKSSFADAVAYLLGPVLGFVLRMKRVVCLHASAVVIDDRAIAFVGVPGAGKSTTAASLVWRGHALVSDDIVAVTEHGGQFRAIPSHPTVGLWPEAVEALCGTANAAPVFSEYHEKHRISVGAAQFRSQSVELGAIFFLEERSAELAAPRVENATPAEALMGLVANTYANLLLDDDLRAREFAFLGRLVNSVAVKRLHAHTDISRIGALCELIENEAASRKPPIQISARQ